MNKGISRLTREQRKAQLIEMFQNKRSQLSVLTLFRKAQPLGKPLTPGMSIIEIILDHEFGRSGGDGMGSDSMDATRAGAK